MHHIAPTPLRIGVSACFLHADPERNLFKGKTLLYAEESMLAWIMSEGALPVLLPRAGGKLSARAIVEGIDALVLQGGADMSPVHYGEEPLRPEWAGDHQRDLYEMELVKLCLEADKPILGCCRGAQVLNVALGGSLWQDIETLHPEKHVHRNWEIYDAHCHEIAVEPESWLGRAAGLGAGGGRTQVNSVHHQGVRELGRGLVVEARSIPDGIIEAIRYDASGVDGERPFALGVQWHPEFMHAAPCAPGELDPRALLRAFYAEVETRRAALTAPGSRP